MTSALFSLLLVPALASPLDDSPAVEFRYSGTLSPVDRNGSGAPVKRFSLYCLVSNNENGSRDLAFLLDERGGGEWAWPERFGLISLDSKNSPTKPSRIQLLHTHNGTKYPLPLTLPLFEHAAKIKPGAKWSVGKQRFTVKTERKINKRLCWQINVASDLGRSQTIWVEKETSLVVRAERQVFMGQGEQFSNTMDLSSVRFVDENQRARIRTAIKSLVTLQQRLGRRKNETKPELSRSQLKSAAAMLARLGTKVRSTPFARLADVIARDVKTQSQRSDDVKDLAKKFVGQSMPMLALQTFRGMTVDPQEYAGKIVLLHFWDYQGEPLEEPYGQVGYLDFLYSRRKKLGVQIYGVAVDSRLSDRNQASAARRSIRKLTSFMNLGYPVTVDDGNLLRKFGDPRKLGAKLPLWVLVDTDGKIVHYKVGYYKINPDEGLRYLDSLIVDEIKKKRAADSK